MPPPMFFQHGVHMIKFFQFLKITFNNVVKNLNSLHRGEHRFSHAFFTKVLHFRDNRKNVQFQHNLKFE